MNVVSNSGCMDHIKIYKFLFIYFKAAPCIGIVRSIKIIISFSFLMEEKNMSKSKINVPEARQAMENIKMEAATEVGVNLKQGYNGDLTSKQAGSIGGQMVKKMIEDYENKIK